jgi:hypothetical protein
VRDYGKVFSRIWESPDFRGLTEDGRTLALYLLTCQHGTIAGVFRVPDGYACEDLQWSAERVAEGFRNLAEKGFATRCEVTKWVWVCKYLEWNAPENPNQRKAAVKCVASIPDACSWKADFTRKCGVVLGLTDIESEKGCGTVSEPLLNQEQEQEQEKNKAPRSASLTVDDLKADGVDGEVAAEFLAIRRRKRAPLTPLAWRGIKRQAERVGWAPDRALRKAVERGWQSFEADWVKGEQSPAANQPWAGAK